MKHFSQLVLQLAISMITIAQTTPNGSLAQPGYYRMQVGDFEITALSDGTIPQDVHQLLTHTQPGEIDRLLKAGCVTAPVETSVNAYVIKTGDRLILVDAGTADAYGPTLGKLAQSLLHAGYQPQQIDAVLLTHIHPDHVGGLMDGDKMVFPNATIYVSQPELDFWLTLGHADSAPAGLKGYFASAKQKVGPYLKAGRVKTFGYGHELLPGITPIASPGHTPGHTLYELDSKGQRLIFFGDIMHVAAVQFADPAVTIQYDIDPAAAAQQRKKAFSEAAKGGYWVAGDHLSFPGIGHIRADGAKYVWVPVNYSTYGTGQ